MMRRALLRAGVKGVCLRWGREFQPSISAATCIASPSLSSSSRFYATQAEYTVALTQSNAAAVQSLLQGTEPFLVHITIDGHPNLGGHNQAVNTALDGVNKDRVLLKCLKGDATDMMAKALMQSLQIDQVPTIAAVSGGRVLDRSSGIVTDEFITGFLSKFLQFAGIQAPNQSEGLQDEDISGDDTKSRFARYVLETKKESKPRDPGEAIPILFDIVQAAEEEVAEEKKGTKPQQKRSTGQPQATSAQETLAHAKVMLADAHQRGGDNGAAAKLLQAVRKEFGRYDIPAVTSAGNMVDMAVTSVYDHKPSKEYALKVKESPEDPALQLKLGVALFQEGSMKEAVAILLQVLRKHRSFNDGAAKKILVAAFGIMGPQNEITIEGRKKMMAYLF